VQDLLFQTAAGPVRLRWTDAGVSAIELPQITDREARAAIAKAGPVQMPAFVHDARAAIERHLAGDPQDLSFIPLDLSRASGFHRKVYQAVRELPAGSTATYGEIAARLGRRGAARAVGRRWAAIRCCWRSRAIACSPRKGSRAGFPLLAAWR